MMIDDWWLIPNTAPHGYTFHLQNPPFEYWNKLMLPTLKTGTFTWGIISQLKCSIKATFKTTVNNNTAVIASAWQLIMFFTWMSFLEFTWQTYGTFPSNTVRLHSPCQNPMTIIQRQNNMRSNNKQTRSCATHSQFTNSAFLRQVLRFRSNKPTNRRFEKEITSEAKTPFWKNRGTAGLTTPRNKSFTNSYKGWPQWFPFRKTGRILSWVNLGDPQQTK